MVKNWQAVFSHVRGALMRRGRTTHEAEDLGQNWGADSCRPGLWVDPSAHHRLEHELGHILVGPAHSEDAANVMFHSGAEDAEVTDNQLDAAEKSADRIVRCR